MENKAYNEYLIQLDRISDLVKSTKNTIPRYGENVTDIDGNVYRTVIIGTQTWMVENLKTTKYRNGDAISNVTKDSEWETIKVDAWCNYDNKDTNGELYGRLYNWNAVSDKRNMAPKGWHVPTNKEWELLEEFLGGNEIAGGKLKEIGFENWMTPNRGATNELGFSARPGGCRYANDGKFYGVGNSGYWWSSTEASTSCAWGSGLGYDDSNVRRNYFTKSGGCSVRCVRDSQ